MSAVGGCTDSGRTHPYTFTANSNLFVRGNMRALDDERCRRCKRVLNERSFWFLSGFCSCQGKTCSMCALCAAVHTLRQLWFRQIKNDFHFVYLFFCLLASRVREIRRVSCTSCACRVRHLRNGRSRHLVNLFVVALWPCVSARPRDDWFRYWCSMPTAPFRFAVRPKIKSMAAVCIHVYEISVGPLLFRRRWRVTRDFDYVHSHWRRTLLSMDLYIDSYTYIFIKEWHHKNV